MIRRQYLARTWRRSPSILAIGIAYGLILATITPTVAEEKLVRATRGVTGFEDAIICCGPGTDGAYDSPEGIARIVKRWKKRGYDGIYFRVSELFLPERFMIHWDRAQLDPVTNFLFVPPAQAIAKFDVLGTMLREGEKQGLDIWVWYPTIYSNGAPPDGPDFSQRWLYENRFGHENPHVLSIDRQGKKHFQIWEYAYPEARKAKVEEFVHLAKQYGVKKFVACLRTEAGQMQPPPDHADQFGFNQPVVDEMQRRYGVDILTDPRFDYKSPTFDVHDPMLENWRVLRGDYLTQLYRELRTALNEIDPSIQIAVQVPGERVGSCLGNWKVDWRTWIDEGLVNEISYRETLDNYTFEETEFDPAKRGYLDIDQPDPQVFRDYIKQSKQPTATLIQAGGPSMSFNNPPAYANGWRIDQWPELWSLAVAQRWQQWNQDVAEFGHIKYLETNFDDFPENSNGYGGGYGEFAYRPDLRTCPGYWFKLGDGTDNLPFTQSKVRRGRKGLAMQLTRAEDGSGYLSARHCARHDRERYPFWTDNAAASGKCQIEFWVNLPDATAALATNVSYDSDKNNEIGIYIAPETGAVFYSQAGQWTATSATVKPGGWRKIVIVVDLEQRVYSASVRSGAEGTKSICRNVSFTNKFNALNWLDFSPQGQTGSKVYVDDVSWRWIPSASFAKPGGAVLLSDGFEQHAPEQSLDGRSAASREDVVKWKIENGGCNDVVIDPTVSYGEEYQSLRFRNRGGVAIARADRFKLPKSGEVIFDVDILPRSTSFAPSLNATPGLTSPSETGAGIFTSSSGEAIAEVRVIDGVWNCWSGSGYVSTNVPAAIDVFSHLQLVIDSAAKEYRVSIQVLGEAPRALWQGPLGDLRDPQPAFFVQLTSRSDMETYDGSAMDNLLMTSTAND